MTAFSPQYLAGNGVQRSKAVARPLEQDIDGREAKSCWLQGPGFSYRKLFMSLSTVLKGGPTAGEGTRISLAIKSILNHGCLSQWPYSVWGMSAVGEKEKIRPEA